MSKLLVTAIKPLLIYELSKLPLTPELSAHNKEPLPNHKHFFYIIFQEDFWTHPEQAIAKAYEKTDKAILAQSPELGRGGSTAVTAILFMDRGKLWVANVGDSRAVLARGGTVIQMTVDHEPSSEKGAIENSGGFVSNLPGT
jgi:protein phosphatase 1L